MSGARTIPKLMELQQECFAQHHGDDLPSSDESDNEDIDASAIPGLLSIVNPAMLTENATTGDVPVAPALDHIAAQNQLQLHDDPQTSAEEHSTDGSSSDEHESFVEHASMSAEELKAAKKAHKKAVKEANREKRKHKMPKHIKKKKMNSHKKK